MNSHLSDEQFARCFVGVSTVEEEKHLLECAECTATLIGFGKRVSSFRLAIRGRIEDQVASPELSEMAFSVQPVSRRMGKVGWLLAAAAVLVIGVIPLVTSQRPEPAIEEVEVEASPDALMNAINAHLSRTIPAPMEPMMTLLPSDELGME